MTAMASTTSRRMRGALESSLAQGFRAIKIKIGEGDLAADLKVVREVRGIIGDGTRLMVDYNQSLARPKRSAACRRCSNTI